MGILDSIKGMFGGSKKPSTQIDVPAADQGMPPLAGTVGGEAPTSSPQPVEPTPTPEPSLGGEAPLQTPSAGGFATPPAPVEPAQPPTDGNIPPAA